MLSIQDVGLSVFSDTPKNFYIFGGAEYGIKDKYIDILVSKVGAKIEYDSVTDVIGLMSKNHIIPLQPQVYVVRYDKNFLSWLNKDNATRLMSLKIVGTLVLIYEDTKYKVRTLDLSAGGMKIQSADNINILVFGL